MLSITNDNPLGNSMNKKGFSGLALLSMCSLAGCDADVEVSGYFIGSPSGVMWETIESDLNLKSFRGQDDNGVWLATGASASLTGEDYAALTRVYEKGFPIVLLAPTAADVDLIADGIGHASGFPSRPDESLEIVAFDKMEGHGDVRSTHTYGRETNAQLQLMAEKTVEWYREAAAELAQPESRILTKASTGSEDGFGGWPTQESWPRYTFTATSPTNVYFELVYWVYPITDITNQTYTYAFSTHLDMQPNEGATIGSVRVTADEPTTNYVWDTEHTCGATGLITDQLSPDSTLTSGSVSSGWAVSVGASVGMTMTGPTASVSTSASVTGRQTTNVPPVNISNRADLQTGALDWTLDYSSAVTDDTSMAFGGVYYIPYDFGQNAGDNVTCGWAVGTDVENNNPKDDWTWTVAFDGHSGDSTQFWWTLHPLSDGQAKAAIGQ